MQSAGVWHVSFSCCRRRKHRLRWLLKLLLLPLPCPCERVIPLPEAVPSFVLLRLPCDWPVPPCAAAAVGQGCDGGHCQQV